MGTQNFTDVAWPGLTFSEGFCPAKVRLNSSAETQINRQRAEMCEYLRSNILSRGKKKEEEKLSCLVLLWNCGFLKKKKKRTKKLRDPKINWGRLAAKAGRQRANSAAKSTTGTEKVLDRRSV